ncbi:MAG TPA: restriction endonuclease subunit S [Caldilinea sp.]|nr:restriction endonuclease subunit S [Caldilinea sp.]
MTEPLTDLPNGWVWTTIGEVAEINKRPPQLAELTDVDEVAFVPMSAVNAESGTIDQASVRPLGEVKRGYSAFADGDVLFAKITPSMENGKAAIAHSLPNGIGFGSTEFHVIRPYDGVSRDWIFHFIRQTTFRADAKASFSGTAGQLRVPEDFVVTYALPLAPLNEQHRIVEAIESYFTRLDAAEAALRRAQARLAQYKSALLKAACEGRLVSTEAELARQERRTYERADDLLARILKERRAKWEAEEWARLVERARQRALADARKASEQASAEPLEDTWLDVPETAYEKYLPKDEKWKAKYQEPAQPDVAGLPELPEGWCWATVEQLGTVQLGRQRSPQNHQGPYMRPYLRAANATWDGLDISDVAEMNFPPADFERYQLRVGDILLSEASGSPNEVGKSFIWREEIDGCCFQNTLIRVQTIGLPPEYLQIHFLKDARTGRFGQIAKGVGIHHLGGQRLAEMAVALPPLAEQHIIISEYDRLITVANAVESAVDTDLRRLAKFRQSILKRAYVGKLVPQSAKDEPAHALLHWIRAEREAQKNVETKTEKKNKKPSVKREISRESVLQTIEEMPQDTFAFDELRNNIAGNYEILRDVLFGLLGETPPKLTLKFDSKLKAMVFVRGHE